LWPVDTEMVMAELAGRNRSERLPFDAKIFANSWRWRSGQLEQICNRQVTSISEESDLRQADVVWRGH
jgi:hypothetical protein